MKLHALCWQDESEPWGGWEPLAPEDADGVQVFHWDIEGAHAALEALITLQLPEFLERQHDLERRIHVQRMEQWERLSDPSRRPTVGVTFGGPHAPAGPKPELVLMSEEKARRVVSNRLSIQTYEVPEPPTVGDILREAAANTDDPCLCERTCGDVPEETGGTCKMLPGSGLPR